MPLRIAVLSDQHIHRAAAPASWELAQQAFRAAAKYDHVVLAGDTFDSPAAFANDHERVREHLAELGLWRRDRLTVVVGNHDLFHTPHRGTITGRAKEFARNLLSFDAKGLVRDRDVEGAFDAWAGELTAAADRLDARRPFPLRKQLGHVTLYAADTAPRRALSAANGFWRPEADALLRAAALAREERRVLAIHHPPKLSRQTRVTDLPHAAMPLAFPPKNFARLARFVDDLEFDAVVCGHIHAAKAYQWEVGRSMTPAFMVGRTGGLRKRKPMFGVLSVPRRGAVGWVEAAIDGSGP